MAFQLECIIAMTQNKWTYSSTYDDHRPRCTHETTYQYGYEIESERSISSRLGSVLGFLTTLLCLAVIGVVYLLYLK